VSTLRVTVPLVPPPVRPVPAITPVIVPVPTAAHCQALPFHCRTWLALHVLVRLRFRVPLVPPPLRPLPLVVVIPVIVPVPGKVCPLAKVNCHCWQCSGRFLPACCLPNRTAGSRSLRE
jgi:hypothetical protein